MLKAWIFIGGLIVAAVNGVPRALAQTGGYINRTENVLRNRFVPPKGYARVNCAPRSFGRYLQDIGLKPHGAVVHYFDETEKTNHNIYVAVVDLDIGKKDLQQCADVIMHVRADYLYNNNRKRDIHFTFTNGFVVPFSKWCEGYRVKVSGNKTSWVKTAKSDTSYGNLLAYMDVVYNYCGTLSMSKELKPIPFADMAPGDVLIKGGSPGHAELVMDVAVDKAGRKVYLLAQSYMPAQQMQVLANPSNAQLSPWYQTLGKEIITPEWDFTTTNLMRFAD